MVESNVQKADNEGGYRLKKEMRNYIVRLKSILRKNRMVFSYLQQRSVTAWIRQRRPIPPPHAVKQLAILYYATTRGLDILVETGTYLGDTIWAQKHNFKSIYSIELSKELFDVASRRFKNDQHVKLLHGDSSERIAEVLSEIDGPALFWLDGHYSGGITARGEKICPIYSELEHILSSPESNTILIDDARLFVGKDDYPTFDELVEFITMKGSFEIKVEIDTIVVSQATVRPS